MTQSNDQDRILDYLNKKAEPSPAIAIMVMTGIPGIKATRILEDLVEKGLLFKRWNHLHERWEYHVSGATMPW